MSHRAQADFKRAPIAFDTGASTVSDKKIIGLSRLITLRQQLDAVARNVANQTTSGFKSGHLRFQEYLTKASEDDIPSAPMRSLVAATQFIDFSPGAMKPTSNPLDAAIVDDSFFVVETPTGPKYTRVGAFAIDNDGRLVTLGGMPVLTSVGRLVISQRDTALTIGADGSVSTSQGTIARLRLVRFEDRRQLSMEEQGLFSSAAPALEVPSAQIRLATGVLEMSNVKPMEEMSKLIAATRAYELVAQVILKEDAKDELKKLAGED
jgi:flagellar basal-body rod protein FlgF